MSKKKSSSEDSLLEELASLDEVTAWMPTGKDHDEGITPPWCELVLETKRKNDWPINAQWALRRHDGELIIDVLHSVLHPRSGGSTTDMLWSELDKVVDRIQKRVQRDKSPRLRDVGQAQGLALAIAILVNPYAYDVDAIRDEAMERWADRHPDPA